MSTPKTNTPKMVDARFLPKLIAKSEKNTAAALKKINKLEVQQPVIIKNQIKLTPAEIAASLLPAAKKAAAAAKKIKTPRVTVRSFVRDLLLQKVAPSDEKILELVAEKFPKFTNNRRHIIWYKKLFTRGELGGMDGQAHTYNQAVNQ